MANPFDNIPGIGPHWASRLQQSGIQGPKDLGRLSADDLVNRLGSGMGIRRAETFIQGALDSQLGNMVAFEHFARPQDFLPPLLPAGTPMTIPGINTGPTLYQQQHGTMIGRAPGMLSTDWAPGGMTDLSAPFQNTPIFRSGQSAIGAYDFATGRPNTVIDGTFTHNGMEFTAQNLGNNILVNDNSRPGGGFLVTGSMTPSGQYVSPAQNLGNAFSSNNFIQGLQAQGSPFYSFSQLTPQNIAAAGTSLALPERNMFTNDIMNVLEHARGGKHDDWAYYQGNHMFRLTPALNETYLMDDQGLYLGTRDASAKGIQLGGMHTEWGVFQSSPGVSSPFATAPIRGEFQQAPNFGQTHSEIYSFRNVLAGEGQKLVADNYGLIARYSTSIIDASQLNGMEIGDIWGTKGREPWVMTEGDRFRGNESQVPGLPVVSGAYDYQRIADIRQNDDGTATVVRELMVNVAGGTSSKLGEKFSNAPVDESFFTANFSGSNARIFSSIPSEKDFASWSRNLFETRFADNTEGAVNFLVDYATGQGVDESIARSWYEGGIVRRGGARLAQQAYMSYARDAWENAEARTLPELFRVGRGTLDNYAGQTEVVNGVEVPVLDVVQKHDDGTFSVRYSDRFIETQKMERFRFENAQPMTLIKEEEINSMGMVNRPLQDYVMGMRRDMSNSARELILSERANYVQGARERVQVVDAEDIDAAKIRARVTEANPDLAWNDLSAATLQEIARTTGGASISVGGVILPSAQVAASNLVRDKDGNFINNLPMAMIDAIEAAQNVRVQRELGGDTSELEKEAMLAASNARSMSKELANSKSTIEKARGLYTSAATGIATAMEGIAENEIVANREDIYGWTNARTEAERAFVDARVAAGELTGLHLMYPQTDPSKAFAIGKYAYADEVRQREGMGHTAVARGQVSTSREFIGGHEKDEDADPEKVVALGRFQDGEWIAADVQAMTPAEVRARANSGFSKEMREIAKKAKRTLGGYMEKVFDPEGLMRARSMEEIRQGYDDRMQSKGWMGKMYNSLVRGMYGFSMEVAEAAGLNRGAQGVVSSAMGNLAKRGYQPALDMELPEESIRAFWSLQHTGRLDSGKKGGKFNPWAGATDEFGGYILDDDGVPLADAEYNNVANVQGVAEAILKRTAGFGREDPEWEQNTMPDLARSLMPLGQATNDQMFTEMKDWLWNYKGEEEDIARYQEITGQSLASSVFGHVDRGLKSVAPALGFLAGSLSLKSIQKNEKYQTEEGRKLLPGLSGKLANILGGVKEFLGVRKPQSLEDAIQAAERVSKDAPTTARGSIAANELLGGSASSDEIAEAQAQTPVAEAVPEIASQALASRGTLHDAALAAANAALSPEERQQMTAYDAEIGQWRQDFNAAQTSEKIGGAGALDKLHARRNVIEEKYGSVVNKHNDAYLEAKDQLVAAAGSGGGIHVPGGTPPVAEDGMFAEGPLNNGNNRGSSGGDRIVDNRPIRGGFVNNDAVGNAEAAFIRLRELRGAMKELAEATTPLTDAQQKYAKTLIATQKTLEETVSIYEKNRGLGLQENRAEAALRTGLMQQEDFHEVRSESGKFSRRLARKLFGDEFDEIAREGSRVPQPSREELWGALGGGQSKAARKLRDQWYEEGRFDDFVPGGRMGAKLAEPLAGLSQVTQDPQLLSGVLWRSGLLSSFLIGPAMGAFADYETNRMETAMAGYQGGVTSYRELMDSQYGDIVRRNAARSMGQQAFGQQVGQAYAPLLEAAISPGGSALGAIAAIGGPAYGVGNIAGALTRSPALGNAVTGIGIALAGASYVANNMTSTPDNIVNSMRLMDALQSDDFGTRLQGGFENFGAAIGMFAGGLGQVGSRILTGKSRIEAQEDWLQNPVYGAVARRFNRGELSREQVQMWYGGMAPTVFQAADTLFLQERGYDETGLQFGRDALSQYRRYFRGGNPPDNDTMTNIEAALASGTDINALVQNRMRSYGVNPANLQRGGETWLMSLEAGVLSGDIAQYTETNTWASAYTAQLNPALRQAGLGETSEDYWKRYFDRPEVAQLQAQRMTWAIGARLDSPSYYGQMGNLFGREMAAAAENNDMAEMARLQNVYGELRQPFDMYTTYGADETETAALLARTRNMSSANRRRTLGIAGGDAYLTSQNWRELGDIRYQLMDTETGLGALEDSINFTEWTALKEDDRYGYLDGINWRDAREGQRGMRNRIRTIQEEQRDYNFQMQRFQANLSNQLQTGGGTVGLGGWAVGGNLDQVASMFEERGMDFMRGNGMTYWQIDDANRRINREQQIYNMEQQERGVEINEGQFALADRQFYERWNQSMRKFEYNTGYQAQEMNISRQQRLTQNQWTREDFAYQENMADMQYGWSMEDFDRNLRYSRGRQRLDLLRQRDRAVITHSMESGMRETREERSETQMEWAEQEFQRKKEHFEQSKEFQKEDLEMQKRHYEERRGFERERLEMTRENHEKQKQWMTERFELEDQRVLLDRQNYELQFTLQEEIATKAYEAQVEMTSLNNALSVTAELSGRWAASLQVMSKNLEGLIKAIDAMNKTSTASSGTMSTAKMEELLSKIANQPAQVNATIYTNKQSINTGSFMSEASTKLRR